MKLRQAFLEDIIELKKICIDAYVLNFYNHWNNGGLKWYLEKEFSIKRLTLDLADINTEYYFIEHQGKQVGFIKTKINSFLDSNSNSVELEKIYLLTECKGLGIGKFALNEIILKSKKAKKQNIFLCVIETNENAIIFYKKQGFKFHSKTTLDIPNFKEELKGMHRMVKNLN